MTDFCTFGNQSKEQLQICEMKFETEICQASHSNLCFKKRAWICDSLFNIWRRLKQIICCSVLRGLQGSVRINTISLKSIKNSPIFGGTAASSPHGPYTESAKILLSPY